MNNYNCLMGLWLSHSICAPVTDLPITCSFVQEKGEKKVTKQDKGKYTLDNIILRVLMPSEILVCFHCILIFKIV